MYAASYAAIHIILMKQNNVRGLPITGALHKELSVDRVKAIDRLDKFAVKLFRRNTFHGQACVSAMLTACAGHLPPTGLVTMGLLDW